MVKKNFIKEEIRDYDTWLDFDVIDSGMQTLEEYNNFICSAPHLEKINVPMLSINSDDDAIIPEDSVPEKKIKETNRILHLKVKSGGHVEYYHGWKMEMVNFELVSMGLVWL